MSGFDHIGGVSELTSERTVNQLGIRQGVVDPAEVIREQEDPV